MQIPIERPCDGCMQRFGDSLTRDISGVIAAFCAHRSVAVIGIATSGVLASWAIRPARSEEETRAIIGTAFGVAWQELQTQMQ